MLEPDSVIVTTPDPRLWFNGPSGLLFLDAPVADPPTFLLAATDALRQISAPAELYHYENDLSHRIERTPKSSRALTLLESGRSWVAADDILVEWPLART